MKTRIGEEEHWMALCLRLARKGVGRVSPNPAVGALLVRRGKVLVEGFHEYFGGPHAEVACLRRIETAPRDATLYVNLEPCTHFGKTPPCVDRILEARIRRVVIGMADPNPRVSGRGIRTLRKAGVTVLTGVLEAECQALNKTFRKNITTGLPYITLKLAMSIDGKLAGRHRWISSRQARVEVHRARAIHDAVLVGSGTVLADNPLLDVRHVKGKNPVVVVLDRRLRIPADAKIFAVAGRKVILCTSSASLRSRPDAAEELRKAGAHIVSLPASGETDTLRQVCRKLYELNIGSVLVEAGIQLSGAFHKSGLVDELQAYVAPAVIGGTKEVFPMNPGSVPRNQPLVQSIRTRRIGPDILLNYQYH